MGPASKRTEPEPASRAGGGRHAVPQDVVGLHLTGGQEPSGVLRRRGII